MDDRLPLDAALADRIALCSPTYSLAVDRWLIALDAAIASGDEEAAALASRMLRAIEGEIFP